MQFTYPFHFSLFLSFARIARIIYATSRETRTKLTNGYTIYHTVSTHIFRAITRRTLLEISIL